ncbi:MAG: leucine-rich repeat domain-containing protein, partial [Leptolyngbya sp. SIO3F4]|nr:leucine-rich repeat domain-containing protein [Leptolyngbya sp. SIO3F4]
MADLDLIEQLGKLLGRPLEEIPEERFERHGQAKYKRDADQDRIIRDAYCLGADGTVSRLLLQPVTSELLFDFPLYRFNHLKQLYLDRVNLPDYSFLKELTGLTTLDLRNNRISDWSFLKELTGLTTLDLSYNRISDWSFLKELTGLTTLDLSYNRISDGSFLKELTGLT